MNWESQKSEILKSYQSNGYVHIPDFLGLKGFSEVMIQVDDFITNQIHSLPQEAVFFEDKNDPGSLKQIQKLFQWNEYFHKLMFDSPFKQVSEFLLMEKSVEMNLQYFNKPPMSNKPTPPHQDGFYFMIDPCDALTMWFALDEVDEHNGCLRYINKSHLQPMRPHSKTKILGFSQGISDYSETDQFNETLVRAKPGDLIIHHAKTIHRADGNSHATRHRRALGFIYYSKQAKQNKAKHAAYQQTLQQELKDSGKI